MRLHLSDNALICSNWITEEQETAMRPSTNLDQGVTDDGEVKMELGAGLVWCLWVKLAEERTLWLEVGVLWWVGGEVDGEKNTLVG
jgi:hypothetical protein